MARRYGDNGWPVGTKVEVVYAPDQHKFIIGQEMVISSPLHKVKEGQYEVSNDVLRSCILPWQIKFKRFPWNLENWCYNKITRMLAFNKDIHKELMAEKEAGDFPKYGDKNGQS